MVKNHYNFYEKISAIFYGYTFFRIVPGNGWKTKEIKRKQ